MKRIIGCIILVMVFVLLIGMTCIVCGWKTGLAIWAIGFTLACVIVLAMALIEGE